MASFDAQTPVAAVAEAVAPEVLAPEAPEAPVTTNEDPEELVAEAPKSRGKRASRAATEKPAKKAKKVVDDTPAKVKAVAAALAIAQKKGVAAEVTGMLQGMLEHALPIYKSERHGFQAEVVDMVGQVLAQAKAALEADVLSASALLENGDAEKVRRAAAVEGTAAQVLSCGAELVALSAAKASALEALQATVEFLKDTQEVQKSGDADALSLEKNKEDLSSTLASLMTMKEQAAGKRPLNALAAQLTKVGLEKSLVECAQLPLAKKPEVRGSFDAVILEELYQALSKKLAAVESELQAAAPAKEVRAASVESAKVGHEAVKAQSEAAAAALAAALAAEKAAKSASAEARGAAKNLTSELLQAGASLDKAKASLEAFRTGPLAALAELREREVVVVAQEAEQE